MIVYYHDGFNIEMFHFKVKIEMNEDGIYQNDLLDMSMPGIFKADEYPLVYGYLNSIGLGYDNNSQFNRDMIRAFSLMIKQVSETSRYMALNFKQNEEIENSMYG